MQIECTTAYLSRFPIPRPVMGYDGEAELSMSNSPEWVAKPLKLAYLEFLIATMSALPVSNSTMPVMPSLLVSLAATPWLVAIVTLKTASGYLEQLGLASEEIFRGDRLPVLYFPATTIPVIEDQPD
jgi:hypothetical protein